MINDRLLSSVRSETNRYSWEDRWLYNALAVVSGRGGAGKSTYVLSKLAALTVGTLPGIYFGAPAHVAVVGALEDGEGPAKLRIQANGGNPDLVHVPAFTDADGMPEGFEVNHFGELREYLGDLHIRVAMIDQLNVLIRDQNKAADVMRVLPPLNDLAHSVGCTVVGINHFRKGGGLSGDLMAGSGMLRNNTRSLILMVADGDDRVATLDKLNLSKDVGQSWKFALASTTVAADDGRLAEVARVEELGYTDDSVERIVNRQYAAAEGTATEDRTEVEQWLEDYLTIHPGEFSQEVKDAAKKSLRCSESTVKRAAQSLGVVTASEGFPRRTTWTLPIADLTDPTDPTGNDKGERLSSDDPTEQPWPNCDPTADPTSNSDLTRWNTREEKASAPVGSVGSQIHDRGLNAMPCRVCGGPLTDLDLEAGDDAHASCGSGE